MQRTYQIINEVGEKFFDENDTKLSKFPYGTVDCNVNLPEFLQIEP